VFLAKLSIENQVSLLEKSGMYLMPRPTGHGILRLRTKW
jgi:hypothetical protein